MSCTSTPRNAWDTHYATVRGARWWPCEELVRAVARRPAPLETVVEVGCGSGANLWFLAEHATRVLGVDLNESALGLARGYMERRRQAGTVQLLRADAAALPLADGTADAVIDAMVSQHVPWTAHAGLFAEYRRALRPGGWLFLYHLTHQTTGATPGTVDQSHVPLFPDARPVCLPSVRALGKALTGAGFRLVETRAMARTYPNGDCAHYAVMEGTA